MNELIQELAMQANDKTGNLFDLNHKELNVFLEKFAEAIVRDCAEFVQFYYKNHRHMCEEIAYDMKQHFGVEE